MIGEMTEDPADFELCGRYQYKWVIDAACGTQFAQDLLKKAATDQKKKMVE